MIAGTVFVTTRYYCSLILLSLHDCFVLVLFPPPLFLYLLFCSVWPKVSSVRLHIKEIKRLLRSDRFNAICNAMGLGFRFCVFIPSYYHRLTSQPNTKPKHVDEKKNKIKNKINNPGWRDALVNTNTLAHKTPNIIGGQA